MNPQQEKGSLFSVVFFILQNHLQFSPIRI